MKNYLSTLNEREKMMVIGAALCLILYCYYLFLYSPLSHQVDQKTTQLQEKTVTLSWMKTVEQGHHKPKTKKSVDNSQLLTLMATKLKSDSTLKFPYQLQQTGTGDIQLTFDEVAFNSFIAWLEKINEKYSITLKQFNAERGSTAGLVKVMVIISAESTSS